MHITKNVCVNTLNTLMDTGGTSKDSLGTRLDMQHLGIRKELHPMELDYGPMKAHDYHVIMTQLLPVALRGILPQRSAPQS